MGLLLLVLFVVYSIVGHSQALTIQCATNSFICNSSARKSYYRCVNGVYDDKSLLFDCPISTYCIDGVTSGMSGIYTVSTAGTTQPTRLTTTTPGQTTQSITPGQPTESITSDEPSESTTLDQPTQSTTTTTTTTPNQPTQPVMTTPPAPKTTIDSVPGGPCLFLTCTGNGVFPVGSSTNLPGCGFFYSCSASGGLPTVVACPSGKHFNQNSTNCEDPALAGCNPALSTSSATTVQITSTTTPAGVTTRPPTFTGAPTCEGHGRLADPRSCRHYYKCGSFKTQGKRIRCPFRLRFDEVKSRCSRNADCGSRPQ
ncbi:uncharacterized protein LOC135936004 [Cloeon dipterum]|uniref:uncharacterized protein LOC135936004 n=1 Tax=Cloeon dipterum TaxID=197152 RepID=UPI00322054D8